MAKFTKRHYAAVASLLRDALYYNNLDSFGAKLSRNTLDTLAGRFAGMFTTDNPKFDPKKFYVAIDTGKGL